jgi:hypothetical protein
MTAKHAQIDFSPAARLLVVGVVVAAAGMLVSYASGVDYATIPRGPITLLVAAAVVALAAGIGAARPSVGSAAATPDLAGRLRAGS